MLWHWLGEHRSNAIDVRSFHVALRALLSSSARSERANRFSQRDCRAVVPARKCSTWKRSSRTRGGNMAKPKIRHLAILARNPKKMADYYTKVFDMEIIHKNPQGTAFFLSDGYITLAVLPHKLEADGSVGLNHFGFQV